MTDKEADKIPGTKTVKTQLIKSYGADGVVDSMARLIDECSRHDLKARTPPTSARKKTIFFQ